MNSSVIVVITMITVLTCNLVLYVPLSSSVIRHVVIISRVNSHRTPRVRPARVVT